MCDKRFNLYPPPGYFTDYRQEIKDMGQCEFLNIHITGRRKNRLAGMQQYVLFFVFFFSCNGKVNIDIFTLITQAEEPSNLPGIQLGKSF